MKILNQKETEVFVSNSLVKPFEINSSLLTGMSKERKNAYFKAVSIVNKIGLLLCHSHIKLRLRLRLGSG